MAKQTYGFQSGTILLDTTGIHIYVNSSHKDSFPFYKRLGLLIATYKKMSDNNVYHREGCSFLINLDIDLFK